MKFTSIVLLAALWSCGANAQQLDFSTMTCQDLTKADQNIQRTVVAWLSGYYSPENGPQTIDVPALNDLQNKLVTFCARETNFTIADAAAGIFDH